MEFQLENPIGIAVPDWCGFFRFCDHILCSLDIAFFIHF